MTIINTKIMAIVNQKGGVGKTTTTMNLATALCALKKKVLIVDLDPQSNSTSGIGAESEIKNTIYELLINDCTLEEAVIKTVIPNLSIIPATMDLAGIEVELATIEKKHLYLSNALQKARGLYDYIIVDCPPSLGILTVNALVAAKEVVIPLQCEYFALEGLSHLMKTIQRINSSFNKLLKVKGIVLTMYDVRNNLSKLIDKDVREYYGSLVYKTVIPRNVKISEAPSHGYPVIVYDPNCVGSKSYIDLATEIIIQDEIK